MKLWSKFLIISILAGTVAACGTATKQDDAGATTDQGQDQRGAATPEGGFKGSPFDDPNNLLSKRTVYFDFDSADVLAEDREIIMAHAQYLASHPDAKVVLEGHTDERGTREYNIALGERRAKAVSQLMLLQGVAQSQMDIISFGEERPVAPEHDESAWRLNRRVEILYSGK